MQLTCEKLPFQANGEKYGLTVKKMTSPNTELGLKAEPTIPTKLKRLMKGKFRPDHIDAVVRLTQTPDKSLSVIIAGTIGSLSGRRVYPVENATIADMTANSELCAELALKSFVRLSEDLLTQQSDNEDCGHTNQTIMPNRSSTATELPKSIIMGSEGYYYIETGYVDAKIGSLNHAELAGMASFLLGTQTQTQTELLMPKQSQLSLTEANEALVA